MRFEPGTARALAALAAWACEQPPARWSESAWWETYASLPEIALTPVSAGALDETTQPFPALRRVSVSPEGRIAVVQENVPAVWIYDGRGARRPRALGRRFRFRPENRGPDRRRPGRRDGRSRRHAGPVR